MSNVFYHSAEARWFIPEKNQWGILFPWFTKQDELPSLVGNIGSFVKHEGKRTDEYLLLANSETVGIKQRQGRLEVKALVASPQTFTLDCVTGFRDEWVKWSFKPSSLIAAPLDQELQRSGPWLAVEKDRYLRKYAIDLTSPVSILAVSPEMFLATGCNVELTHVKVEANTHEWITLGFEAFGSSENVATILNEVMKYNFALLGASPVPLEVRESLSYPSWLAKLK